MREFRSKVEVKRRRAHKQDATEKRLLFEDRTKEYASGIGLQIGHETSKPNDKKKKAKRTKCKCGSTTHLTANSKQYPLNKKNLLKASVEDKVSAEEATGVNFDEDNI